MLYIKQKHNNNLDILLQEQISKDSIRKSLLKHREYMLCIINKTIVFLLLVCSITFGQKVYFVKFAESVSVEQIKQAFIAKKVVNLPVKKSFAASDSLQFRGLGQKFKISDSRVSRIYKIILPEDISPAQFQSALNTALPIEYAEPAHTYKTDGSFNDSLLSQQWALNKMDAFSAWNLTQGSDTVLVGIVDTGIDYTHPDLRNKIFMNQGEIGLDANNRDKSSNGIDDDGNGFIDDYMGWDFTNRVGFPFDSTGGDYLNWDNNPFDDNSYSHGTSVAGIIGAEANNSIGIAGVAPGVRLLNCRAFDPEGYGNEEDVASAILYAASMGAKVINMSFGDNSFSYVLRDVIRYAYSKNIVLVASSGNDGSDLPHYPSGYSEVISVGNSTNEDYVSSNSSYGSTLDLIAPGTNILTTFRGNQYYEFSGTSASAPFVSAAASLILSKGNFSNEEVKQIIKSTCDENGASGWDIHSGSGRLNVGRALRVLAPAIIKFNYPFQDFSTSSDTVQISGTILSAYFRNYSIYYGIGYSPENWMPILTDQKSQLENGSLGTLSISHLPDTIVTFRIVVEQSNGTVLEERINIHKVTKKPDLYLISSLPAMYGNKPTIVSAIYSTQSGIGKMYYRELGTREFSVISMDGISMNTSFVQNAHYGFIPASIAKPNTAYEIYYEFENLAGLKTKLFDTYGNYFLSTTPKAVYSLPTETLPYSLPRGLLFGNTANLTGNNSKELLLNKLFDYTTTYIYSLNNNSLLLKDSIAERIPKDVGDFNGNGKIDIAANWGRNLYILEQDSIHSTKFVEKYKKENSTSWPVMVNDLSNDGKMEALVITDDSTISVFHVNSDLSLDSLGYSRNFIPISGRGVFNYPKAVLTDVNKDSKNELFLADTYGNVLCYNVNPDNSLTPDTVKTFSKDFYSSTSSIAAGDFNGDGYPDIAVLLHSIDQYDIAKYYLLAVVTFVHSQPEIIFSKVFIDPAAEFDNFTRKTYNSIKFVDVDSDGADELVLSAFPFAYILKYNPLNGNNVIYYKENVNANSVLAEDLNGDGKIEIGIPDNSGINFFRFSSDTLQIVPSDVSGYSIDPLSVQLKWRGNSANYYIYRSTDSLNYSLIDSTVFTTIKNNTIVLGKSYYYKIAIHSTIGTELFSAPFKVFHHRPASLKKYFVTSQNRSIRLEFSEQITTSIDNLTNFHLSDSLGAVYYPTSISPASQYAYQVTFNSALKTGSYKLYITGMKDYYLSPIKADSVSVSFTDSVLQKEFYIEKFSIVNPYLISLKMNLPIDSASFLNTANYKFTPVNAVSTIVFDKNDPATVFLSLKGGKPVGSVGIEYVMQVNSVYSSLSTGKIAIKSGAGSVLQLSTFASGVEAVYVYPNPVRGNSGAAKMTFANLPKHAEIIIFSLQGKKMKTLVEQDGNGGLSWDILDESGHKLSSGIYLYLVRQLDGNNEEINTKLEKFTVIR